MDFSPHPLFRSGFIALVGRPNVGKSTLLNRFVGQKVAITSPVAQTTRRRLRGILTLPQAQLIFVDTPGIHKPHHLLGERLVNSAKRAIGEVDLVLLLMNGSSAPGRGDAFIVDLLKHSQSIVHVALNHWDLVRGPQIQELMASYRRLLSAPAEDVGPSWPLHPVSALTGSGIEDLMTSLIHDLPVGPPLYPRETVCDQSEETLLSELIREQVLLQTREEVPHSVAVMIDKIVDTSLSSLNSSQRMAVLATVFVERQSQKVILIGRGGQMLKSIGSAARSQMEALLNCSVYLELFVKVVPNWRRSTTRLAELGYGIEN